MTDIDSFARTLLEEAKRFLEKAADAQDPADKSAFLHAALVIGVCALEAQVNALSQELALRDGLSILDQSILLEKDYSLDKGVFNLTAKLKMYRLEDRVVFIFKRFTARAEVNKEVWWGQVKAAIDLRNDIVHPKTVADLSEERVERALSAVLECVNELYQGLFHKPYPGYGRKLASLLTF